MSKDRTGTSRVTVFRLLYDWPDRHCVVAYTAADSLSAVVATIPVPGVEGSDPDLARVAAAHAPGRLYGGPKQHAEGAWLVNVGTGARLVPPPTSFEAHAPWRLEQLRSYELDTTMYGYDRVHVGQFELIDSALAEKAHALLATPASVTALRSRV
ncbi:hypothetical protein ACH429_14940 [Streptomyces pathocidini]|uniref:Uncharacterized protein n=1 Tax=Streptomyces pathocidini TaxID=1650571 RepID=A0ABW7UVL1_9ACTN|nr:hypothetical protein [Streptomyces pathocidini]